MHIADIGIALLVIVAIAVVAMVVIVGFGDSVT